MTEEKPYPQIKLDFLFLLQTYVLASEMPESDALTVTYVALKIDPACLIESKLMEQVNEFADFISNHGRSKPEWLVYS